MSECLYNDTCLCGRLLYTLQRNKKCFNLFKKNWCEISYKWEKYKILISPSFSLNGTYRELQNFQILNVILKRIKKQRWKGGYIWKKRFCNLWFVRNHALIRNKAVNNLFSFVFIFIFRTSAFSWTFFNWTI